MHRWEYNIKMELKVECKGVDWTELVQRQMLVNTIMNFNFL